jgi:hypothetical protein
MPKVQTLSVVAGTFKMFLESQGMWRDWKRWLKDMEWSLEEMGMKDNKEEEDKEFEADEE